MITDKPTDIELPRKAANSVKNIPENRSADIRSREQALNALKASEKNYRDVVENANSVILRWDTEGNIIYLNPFGISFFGYAMEEIMGKNVVGTIVPETESFSSRDLTQLMKDIQSDPEKYKNNENEILIF